MDQKGMHSHRSRAPLTLEIAQYVPRVSCLPPNGRKPVVLIFIRWVLFYHHSFFFQWVRWFFVFLNLSLLCLVVPFLLGFFLFCYALSLVLYRSNPWNPCLRYHCCFFSSNMHWKVSPPLQRVPMHLLIPIQNSRPCFALTRQIISINVQKPFFFTTRNA